jgi:23S rRNA (uracil1939-C5)-methyltransferase
MNKICNHFQKCGGCELLDKNYKDQLTIKHDLLNNLFWDWNIKIPPVIGSPQPYYYRHKVQLPFGEQRKGKQHNVILGCYGTDSHEVIDQNECHLQDPELSIIAWNIKKWAQETGLTVYNEKYHQGFLRHVLLRKGAGTGEILIGLVTNGERPEGSRFLSGKLLELINKNGGTHKIVGIVQNVNTRKTNVVLGNREYIWWGRPYIKEKLGELKFKVGLSTFFQVNPYQTPNLYNQVFQNIPEKSRVIDLYCGVGSISLWISRQASKVFGIEENAASVQAARTAASLNGLRNVSFLAGDVSELLSELVIKKDFDIAVVDPPRKGLDSEGVKMLTEAHLKRIIYVSCNPQSLCEDLKNLNGSYHLSSVTGVDMFPQTTHVECVAVLDKK